MKKIFTLIAAAFLAASANAQTATDAYLDIANYASLDNTSINLKGCTKLYSYDATKKILVLSAYAAYQTSQQNQEEGKTGLGFVTYSSASSSTATWAATGDFKGSSYYGLTSGGNPSDRAASINTSRAYTFTVKGITKVSILGKSGSSSRNVVMTVKNGETVVATKTDKSNTVATLTVEDLDVNTTYSVTVTGDNASNGHFYEIAFYQVEEILPPTAATTWNFTQALSPSDNTNLSADATNWEYNSENDYWANKVALTERNVFTALKANNVELDIVKGFTFTRDNSAGLDADKIRIEPGKYFTINGSAVKMNFGTLVKNDIIRLRIKAGGASERSLEFTNAEATAQSSPLTTADTDEHDIEVKVLTNGGVILGPTGGYRFLAITINNALPSTTGINDVKVVEPATVKDGAIFNLAGQKVNESYKGVVISNGKKMIQK